MGISEPRGRRTLYIAGFLLTSILLSLLVEQVFGRFIDLRPDAVGTRLQGWGLAAPALYVALMVLAIVVTPIP